MSLKRFGPDSGEIVYVNADVTYTDSLNPNRYVPAQLMLTRTVPILERADDYLMTIARMEVSNAALPLCVAEIQPNQPNPNLTKYSFTVLGYDAGGVAVTGAPAYVTYVPTDLTATPPGPVGATQDNSTGYYYIYDYVALVSMFNTAIGVAFANAIASGADATGVIAPNIYFDSASGLLSVTAQQANWCSGGAGATAPPLKCWKLFYNGIVSNFFVGIPFQKISSAGGSQQVYQFQFDQNANNIYARPALGAGDFITISMSNSAQMGYWSSLNAVIVQTSLPITNPEATQPPYGASTFDSTDTLAMMTDFAIAGRAGEWNAVYLYTPETWERFYSLAGSVPLSKIQFNLLWQDNRNNVYPFLIRYNTKVSLKIAFVSRAYWMNTRHK